jgi:hypothetical protein
VALLEVEVAADLGQIVGVALVHSSRWNVLPRTVRARLALLEG